MMVDAMKRKMAQESQGMVGQEIVEMEEEAVEGVFEEGPEEDAEAKDLQRHNWGETAAERTPELVRNEGKPDERHGVPGRTREDVEPRVGKVGHIVRHETRAVNLIQIE